MKQLLLFSFIFLTLPGCKKVDLIKNPDIVRASIQLNGTTIQVSNDEYSSSITRGVLPIFETEFMSITGWTTLYSKMQILLPYHPQRGSYSINGSGEFTASYYDGENLINYSSTDNSGTITIDSVAANFIMGTFQYECFDANGEMVKVTNGTFSGTFD